MPELQGPKWEIGLPALGQAAFAGADGQETGGTLVMFPKK
jgi:hypothetical protein